MPPSTREIQRRLESAVDDNLLTDGYARALELEVEELRSRRRMRAALMDASGDKAAAREASELAARCAELHAEQAELRRSLRAAAERSGRFRR